MPDLPDLNDLHYFVRIVDSGGFAAASRVLHVPKSSLSRRILALEARLGTSLIHRTSRRFAVTAAGAGSVPARARHGRGSGSGAGRREALAVGTGWHIRFTCSIGIARYMASLVTRFLLTHPKIDIIQHVTNRFVDLVEEGLDIAVRAHTGPLPDSALVQRSLGQTSWHLFAAPLHLDRFGSPSEPAELAGQPGLSLGSRNGEPVWKLRSSAGAETDVAFAPRLASDDLEMLKHAAIAGLGILAAPGYACRAETEAGSLRRVLPRWTAGDGFITLLMPSRRGLLPSVRAFADFLATEFPPIVGG